jgi:hypothetical protein
MSLKESQENVVDYIYFFLQCKSILLFWLYFIFSKLLFFIKFFIKSIRYMKVSQELSNTAFKFSIV